MSVHQKNKKKKSNTIIGVLILLIGISAVVLLMGYSYNQSRHYLSMFTKEKKSLAQPLYDRVMTLSDNTAYPANPDDVMDVYNAAYLLLYGDMILDEKLVDAVLKQQRKLFSTELLASNPYDTQMTELKRSLAYLTQMGVHVTAMEKKSALFEEDDRTKCSVRVTQTTSIFKQYYWLYSLKKDATDHRWKIVSWQATDENFNPMSV